MEPVMTQPTEGEIWKMCDTDDGSISLSCGLVSSSSWSKRKDKQTYGNFLLRQDYGAVFAAHPDGHDIGRRNSFEGIFYPMDLASALMATGQHS